MVFSKKLVYREFEIGDVQLYHYSNLPLSLKKWPNNSSRFCLTLLFPLNPQPDKIRLQEPTNSVETKEKRELLYLQYFPNKIEVVSSY